LARQETERKNASQRKRALAAKLKGMENKLLKGGALAASRRVHETRVHQTRSWLVSGPNLSRFGPSRGRPGVSERAVAAMASTWPCESLHLVRESCGSFVSVVRHRPAPRQGRDAGGRITKSQAGAHAQAGGGAAHGERDARARVDIDRRVRSSFARLHAIEPATTSHRWRRASTPSSRHNHGHRRVDAIEPTSARERPWLATQARAGVQEGRGRREVWKHRRRSGKENPEARETNKKSVRGGARGLGPQFRVPARARGDARHDPTVGAPDQAQRLYFGGLRAGPQGEST
jgi:hypothetical protein